MPIRSWHLSHRFFFGCTSNGRIRNGHQLQPIEILGWQAKVIEPDEPGRDNGRWSFLSLASRPLDLRRQMWSEGGAWKGRRTFCETEAKTFRRFVISINIYLVRLSYFLKQHQIRSLRVLWSCRETEKESKNILLSESFVLFLVVFPQIQATRSNNEQIYRPFENKTIPLRQSNPFV